MQAFSRCAYYHRNVSPQHSRCSIHHIKHFQMLALFQVNDSKPFNRRQFVTLGLLYSILENQSHSTL